MVLYLQKYEAIIALGTIDGPQLQALDHDFHVHDIVPSAAFFIDCRKVILTHSSEVMLLLRTKIKSLSHHML